MVFNNLIFYCKLAFVLCSGSQQGSAVTSYATYLKYLLDLNFFYFQRAENSAVSQDLGFHIALPQKLIPQMSSFAELAKLGPISHRIIEWSNEIAKSNEIADLISECSTFRCPVFAYCKVLG